MCLTPGKETGTNQYDTSPHGTMAVAIKCGQRRSASILAPFGCSSTLHTDETTMYYYDTNSKSRRMAPSPTSTGINSTSAVDDHNQKGEASSTSGNVDTLISFFVTGFGPFGGNPENPTSTIIEALQQEQTAENPRLSNVHLLNIIRVSASSAAEEVNRIIGEFNRIYSDHPTGAVNSGYLFR